LLIILPVITFGVLFLILRNTWVDLDSRLLLLRSAVITGLYAVLMTELLSLVDAVTQIGVALSWCLLLLISILALAYLYKRGDGLRFPGWRWPESRAAMLLLVGITSILVATAIVAWFAPPNTWDSMTYHMSRVAHWAQEHSIRPFTTGIEIQNSMPPGAEILVLQTYVLDAGDRWANFIEWAAMLLSVISVMFIASKFGIGTWGQLASALFVVTLPNGVMQATSTMSDYVVTLWIVCIAAETVELVHGTMEVDGLISMSAAAGLALLTKPTAVAFVFPFGVWIGYLIFQRSSLRQVILWGFLAFAIVMVINSGHFLRNYSLYSNPIGPKNRITGHANQVIDGRAVVSNVLRNAALHAGTPSTHVNKAILLSIIGVHELMNFDVNDPRTTFGRDFKIRTPSMHETQAGNLFHSVIILMMLAYLVLRRKKFSRLPKIYTVVVLTTFIIFSATFQWQVFGSRFHVPFFVLMAPIFGAVLAASVSRTVGMVLCTALWFASLPWVLGNNSRPLVSGIERTYINSVLIEPRDSTYLANGTYLERPYQEMSAAIRDASCEDVGLMLHGNSAEYPLWVFLGAPSASLNLQWIVAGTPSAALADTTFKPCAIICEDCSENQQYFRGLPLTYERSGWQLYLANDDT
jgi:hypothetical protein